MDGYVKLFGSILGSTIWREDPATKVIWITLLALTNRDGVAEVSVPGLATFAGVTIEETERALEKFSAADPYSRSPEHEGRRIQRVDGGFLILNHGKYRDKLSAEDRRERDRLRQQRHREQQKCHAEGVTKRDSHKMSRMSRHPDTEPEADTDTKAKTKTKKGAATRKSSARPFVLPRWIPVKEWADYLEMRQRNRKPMTVRAMELAVERLAQLRDAGDSPAEVLDQSTLNSWQSVYPLRREKGESGSGLPRNAQQGREALAGLPRIEREKRERSVLVDPADQEGWTPSPVIKKGLETGELLQCNWCAAVLRSEATKCPKCNNAKLRDATDHPESGETTSKTTPERQAAPT